MTLYDFFQKASNALYRFFAFPVIRVSLGKCGKHVRVAKGRFSGINNVQIGNNVYLLLIVARWSFENVRNFESMSMYALSGRVALSLSFVTLFVEEQLASANADHQIGRASCRERV